MKSTGNAKDKQMPTKDSKIAVIGAGAIGGVIRPHLFIASASH
jgi:hypothetical protein